MLRSPRLKTRKKPHKAPRKPPWSDPATRVVPRTLRLVTISLPNGKHVGFWLPAHEAEFITNYSARVALDAALRGE